MVVNSVANNLLVGIPKFLPDLVNKLNERGVSVVDGSSFNFGGPKFIRLSPRLRETNEKFIEIIDQILSDA